MAYLPTVYVVDNDQDFLGSCTSWLRSEGCRVETFSSAEDFWDSAWRQNASCLITDLWLGLSADGSPAVDDSVVLDGNRAADLVGAANMAGALGTDYSAHQAAGCGEDFAARAPAAYRLPRLRGNRISGIELQCRVRRCINSLPVIFTGTPVSLRLICGLFQQGAFDFHEKPATERDLRRSVSMAVSRKNRRSRNDDAAAVEAAVSQRIERLTPREFEVLGEMLRGMSIKQMATRFDISIQTSAKHRARVLSKMRCENEMHVLHLLGRRWHLFFSDIVV